MDWHKLHSCQWLSPNTWRCSRILLLVIAQHDLEFIIGVVCFCGCRRLPLQLTLVKLRHVVTVRPTERPWFAKNPAACTVRKMNTPLIIILNEFQECVFHHHPDIVSDFSKPPNLGARFHDHGHFSSWKIAVSYCGW